MSAFNQARVTMLLADYAINDAAGKLNIVGGNISQLPVLPHGSTPAFSLVLGIEHPTDLAGTQYSISVELWNETLGSVAQAPGPTGALEAMRVQQVATVAPAVQLPGWNRPPDTFSRHSLVMNFGNGMQLPVGNTYEWRLQIDGKTKGWWTARFHVLAPDPSGGFIIGGPTNPSTIPGVPVPVEEDPDEGSDQ